ncbi:hypothetical protein [Nonomuraea polychroma]|uniref:hypothetical protein n=1 Tax=Nonomuraea polychroma TaxID=46176 RepID=UPI000FDDFEE4|nr:hypothetical protein [Nonomuraea polychroma]
MRAETTCPSLDRVDARLTERVGPLPAAQGEDERAEGVEPMLSELLPLAEPLSRSAASVLLPWTLTGQGARTR